MSPEITPEQLDVHSMVVPTRDTSLDRIVSGILHEHPIAHDSEYVYTMCTVDDDSHDILVLYDMSRTSAPVTSAVHTVG